MSLLGKKILQLFNKPHKAQKSSNSLLSYEDSKQVGIIYTWTDQSKASLVDDFLKKMDKEVSILCFNPNKEEINSSHPTLNMAELSATGKFKSEVANNFLSKHFDFLFVLDFELTEISKHLIIKSKANYRVGCHIADEEAYFDLMIGVNENDGIANFTAQLLKYVKAISNA